MNEWMNDYRRGASHFNSQSSLSICFISKVLLEHNHPICLYIVYGSFYAEAELTVVIETVWLTESEIFTVWPFNWKSLMVPVLGSQTWAEQVTAYEGHCSLAVKNMGSRIGQTCVWILAPPLTCCKTMHIISPLWVSVFSSERWGW